MTEIYYKITSMEQLQKVYEITQPDLVYMLYHYINHKGDWEYAEEAFKKCLREYGHIYFNVNGVSSCWISEKDSSIIIDIEADRYSL